MIQTCVYIFCSVYVVFRTFEHNVHIFLAVILAPVLPEIIKTSWIFDKPALPFYGFRKRKHFLHSVPSLLYVAFVLIATVPLLFGTISLTVLSPFTTVTLFFSTTRMVIFITPFGIVIFTFFPAFTVMTAFFLLPVF